MNLSSAQMIIVFLQLVNKWPHRCEHDDHMTALEQARGGNPEKRESHVGVAERGAP